MMLRTGRRSFTLIEVLVSVAILSVGIVFIFRSFFTCLNAFGRYVTYLNIMPWMNEQLWRAEDEIIRTGKPVSPSNQGEFTYEGKKFSWYLVSSPVDKNERLYRLDLAVSWQEARKQMTLNRYAYTALK
jgi:prepilin-type N-terminal cleavage/methylation domain-containing protein